MAKISLKPGTLLSPLPAVMVSCGNGEEQNIITIAWTGIVNSDPPMTYISVRKSRHSHKLISETGEYVINLTTEKLLRAADYCGVRSGRNVDKWKECSLTPETPSSLKWAPVIKESPVNIECKVTEIKELGSHHMFLANVQAVQADEEFLNKQNKFELNKTGLIAYSHGEYLNLGKKIGTFGHSVRKKKNRI